MTGSNPQLTSSSLKDADVIELSDMSFEPHDHDENPNAPLIARDQSDQAHDTPSSLNIGTDASANVFVWALTVSAGVSGLLFGYDTGVISSTLVSIGSDLSSRPLSNWDKGLITSCTSLFALVASPSAGVLADKVGRKKVILVSDALFTFGALWQALTSTVWGMILGRSIVGLAIGGASLITPLYIGELSPGHLRGRLVTVSSLLITGGQVVAYVIGWLFSTTHGGWRWMVGLGALPSLTQLILLVFMPETPRYLARIGEEEKARAILRKVYKSKTTDTTETADDVLLSIKKEILEEEEAKLQMKITGRQSSLPPIAQSLLYHPPHFRALVIACLLQGLQQLCGFNSLMYYSATIFDALQFSSPTLTSLSIAITNFVFTLVAFYLIDRIGRRKILLLTIPLMTGGLLLCALAFTYVPVSHAKDLSSGTSSFDQPAPSSRLSATAVLVSLLIYVSSYATGLGNVPWQQSELFPLSVRSLGSSISTATNWGTNTIIGLTFLPMMQLFTPTWTFVSYAVVCLIGWLCVWQIYPETAGLGLEDVSALLKDGWGVTDSVQKAKDRKARRALEVHSRS